MGKFDLSGEKPNNENIIHVGVTKNKDGTPDYSKSMKWVDPDGKLAERFKKSKENAEKQKDKRFEIPSDVKPGTSIMVFYNLRNEKIRLEDLKKEYETKKEPFPESENQELTNLNVLNSMINNSSISEEIKNKIINENKSLSQEEIREKMHDLPAKEMVDYVQKIFVNHFKKLKEQGKRLASLQEGHFSKKYSTEYLLAVAQNLQNRLLEESRNPTINNYFTKVSDTESEPSFESKEEERDAAGMMLWAFTYLDPMRFAKNKESAEMYYEQVLRCLKTGAEFDQERVGNHLALLIKENLLSENCALDKISNKF